MKSFNFKIAFVFLALIFAPHIFAAKPATAKDLKLMQGFPPPANKRVNKSNALLTPPYNRWSYQHMRTIYPSAGIKNAPVAVNLKRAIDKGINNVKVMNPATKKKASLDAFLKDTYTDAFVVIDKDKIVYEKYLNGMNADTPHQMMSVTKSFAGLLALMAVAEGKINEKDLVTKYVPELKKSSAFKGATVEQVLDMVNSMLFTEKYDDPNSGIRQYGVVVGWMQPEPNKKYAPNLYEYLTTLKKDPKLEHGKIFHYQTPKTDVVNWITNRATNKSFQEYLYEQVWSKIGTNGEDYILLDNNGTLVAGGGLNATPNDLSKFATMMINDGMFNGKQVVPKSVIQKLSKGGSIEAFSKGPESAGFQAGGDWSYRAQWWIRHTPGKEAILAIGIHGQWIYLDVNKKIAIIKQSSQPKSKDDYFNGYDYNAFNAIVDYLVKQR